MLVNRSFTEDPWMLVKACDWMVRQTADRLLQRSSLGHLHEPRTDDRYNFNPCPGDQSYLWWCQHIIQETNPAHGGVSTSSA